MSYQYVHGVEEVMKNLLEFPVKVEAQVTRGALRTAAQVVRAAALFRTPRASGALAGTIRVFTRKRGKEISAGVRVGNRKKGIFYAHMVMGGTKPHIIKARAGGWLGFGGIVVRRVQHPGTKPQPFMEEAINFSRYNAFQAAFAYATARIKKIIVDQNR
jgi:HK97 gp10 family phage protein